MSDNDRKELTREQLTFPVLDKFVDYVVAIRNRSENTVRSYLSDLRMFFRFLMVQRGLADKKTPFEEIAIDGVSEALIQSVTYDDFLKFLTWMAQHRQTKATTRSRTISSLRTFFAFCSKQHKILEQNPALDLESPSKPKVTVKALELEEAQGLLQTIDQDDSANAVRNYCMVTLLLNCGMRVAELCSIDLLDYKGETIVVKGKGGKERTAYLNGACFEAIDAYLPVRETTKALPGHEDAMFLSQMGYRISVRSVERMLDKYYKMLGIDTKRYGVHTLRHTAATLMYRYGKVDVRRLQEILGHSSLQTTQIYTHVDADSLHDAVESNPLAGRRRDAEV